MMDTTQTVAMASSNADGEPVNKRAKLCEPDGGSNISLAGASNLPDTADKCHDQIDETTNSEQNCISAKETATVVESDKMKEPATQDDKETAEKPTALTEVQAGISEYLGNHTGFSAIIKQRYSDFIVNEVDLDGKVVHLTDLSPPEEINDEEAELDEKKEGESSDVIGAEDLTRLETLVKEGKKNDVVNIEAPEDKALRTKVHMEVKKRFTQLETKTTEVDGKKVIQVLWRIGRPRDSQRDEWPKSKKSCRYVKFVLYKENKDTMDSIGLISKQLKVKESLFQYAGTKDKRAKTSQHITAHRIHPRKLSFLNKVLWNMGLGNFQYVTEPLKLGQLSGNQFTIVLRNVQGSQSAVDESLTSLKSEGFINYFGMQRFGTTAIPTHKVGSALLHGDWDKAIELILMPRDDNPSKDVFQKVWIDTHDPEATLKVTPRFCGLERNLLEALKKKMKPFNALEKISRNTRMLYVHSYQALVWNQMVSRRLRELGHKPVVGDLVLTRDAKDTDTSTPVAITAEDLDQYSIHDIVMPLPGYDVIYPQNNVHNWYKAALESDGLDIDNMKRPQKDYSLPGAYRQIVVRPSDVSWSYHRYDDYTLPITLSDLDIVKGESSVEAQNKGKLKALLLKMILPPSCYATMALREVLRTDTSVAHQTSLNVT